MCIQTQKSDQIWVRQKFFTSVLRIDFMWFMSCHEMGTKLKSNLLKRTLSLKESAYHISKAFNIKNFKVVWKVIAWNFPHIKAGWRNDEHV